MRPSASAWRLCSPPSIAKLRRSGLPIAAQVDEPVDACGDQGSGDLPELAREPAQPVRPATGEHVGQGLLGAIQYPGERGK